MLKAVLLGIAGGVLFFVVAVIIEQQVLHVQ